ncbi:hypothetical protein PS627_04515 [Pseudomonas fluorescens]|nr:hypothetical protein PS627_04515 [Pseudomonas fluorescens]
MAHCNGNGLTIRQTHHDRRAGDGSTDAGGVNNCSALSHTWRCSQGDGRGVGDISHRRADRSRAGGQVLVVAAADRCDAVGDRGVALIGIVRRGVVDRARTLTNRDGDGLTIRQADHDRRAGDGSTDASGVNNGPTLDHAWRGGEDDGRRVGHIGDRGADRSRAGGQVLVVAPSHTGDAVGDWSIALVGIVGCGVVDRPQALADRNGNRLPVGQADNNRSTSNWRIYRSGVNDRTALGHAWGSSEGHGRSIGHIGDRSADRRRAGGQVFIVAATDAGDAVGNRRIVLIGIVGCGVVHRAGALAYSDGNGLAVRQGHDHRRPGNRCFNRGGIHDGPTLGDAGRGGEGDSRGVGHVGDRGADRGRAGGQVFIVPAGDPGDAVGNRSVALIGIVRRGVVD